MAGPATGHGRAVTADSTSERQVSGPANLSNLQLSPLLAQLAIRLQLPGISQRPGYWQAPHRYFAELSSWLCFLERRRHPANLSGFKESVYLGLERKSKVVKLLSLLGQP